MREYYSWRIFLAVGSLAVVSLACSLDDILFPKTFYVTKTADTADGECSADDCSLREAVIASNETAGHNTIVIPAGTYVLTIPGVENAGDTAASGDLDITDGVDIEGALWTTFIDGNATNKIFEVYDGVRVEMRGLTIQHGDSYTGGGISNAGDLTMIDSTVNNNTAHLRGGGIANGGTLRLLHAFIVSNTSEGSGGGLYNGWGGTLIVEENTSIFGNTATDFGGGLFNEHASQTEIIGSSLYQNSATNGGGIANEDEVVGAQSSLLLTDVAITDNSAGNTGGGIYNAGGLKIIRADIGFNSASSGAGIYNIWDSSGDIGEATGVVLHANIAFSGGGLYDNGRFRLSHSAVINNQGGGLVFDVPKWGPFTDCALGSAILSNVTVSATTVGAGISARCDVELTNLTIAFNEGIGLLRPGFGIPDGIITLRNTIVANNAVTQCMGASIVSDGFNLESANTCGFSQPGDLIDIDPLLDMLQADGSTFVHPLLAGSPAIDAADPAACPATDQRGAPRPFGPACDIGAYEFGATAPLPRLVPTLTGSPSESPSPTQILPTSPTPTVSPTLQVFVEPTATRTPRPTDTPPEVIVTDTATSTQQIIIFTKPPKSTSTPTPQVIIINTSTATPTQPIIIVTFVKPPKITDTPIP